MFRFAHLDSKCVDLDFDVVNGNERRGLDSFGGLTAHDFDVHTLLIDQDVRNTLVLKLEPFLGADKVVGIADIGLQTLDEHVELMLVGILGPVVLVGTAGDHPELVVHIDLKQARKEVGTGEDHVVKHKVDLHIGVLDTWDGNELEGLKHCRHEDIAEVVKQVRLELELPVTNRWLEKRQGCTVLVNMHTQQHFKEK